MMPFAVLLMLIDGQAAAATPASAQMSGMAMPATPAPAPNTAPTSRPRADPAAVTPAMTNAAGGDMAAMPAMAGMPPMRAMLGWYPMQREGSGTAWQPDSTPMRGLMFRNGGWSLMGEGWVTGIEDQQAGPRGDNKVFSQSMAMLMASRDASTADRIGLRGMLSLDPLMGARGYPLLFATGETADGHRPLVDRQHPHDLFMELAATWTHDLGDGTALALYGGLPGEPALGPPTFMHRMSGMDDPEAPIGHHWFDSTHITYGVVSAGLSHGTWKIEASAFKGREPDQHRWNIETPRLDSWSVRIFWNPTANLSLQASTGHLHSPEQLDPRVDEQRTTASATYNRPLGPTRNWAMTIAWSSKNERPGPALTGLLAETALQLGQNELYARVEHEQEDELFQSGPLAGRIFRVTKASLGAQHEVPLGSHLFAAFGAVGSAYAYPSTLTASYGARGVKSVMVYGRLRFGT